MAAISAGRQILADRKNCSSLFPDRDTAPTLSLFFSGYRLVNHCQGRGQLSNIQKASNAVIMNIKTEYEDEIFFLKTLTVVYMYSCITKFAGN